MNPTQPAAGEDSGMPPLRADHPRIYDRLWLLVALTLVILAVGAALLYRRGDAVPGKK